MILLQGLEKVQVTIQTQSETVAGINNNMKMYKTNRASAVSNQTLQTVATKYAD